RPDSRRRLGRQGPYIPLAHPAQSSAHAVTVRAASGGAPAIAGCVTAFRAGRTVAGVPGTQGCLTGRRGAHRDPVRNHPPVSGERGLPGPRRERDLGPERETDLGPEREANLAPRGGDSPAARP